MPNNVLKGTYLNAEFRYPFRMFGSTRSQVYVAYYANETNIGLITRESRLAGAVFDFRAKTDKGKFGVITAFVNARFKLGDFFDEKEKK